ncbi:unnamed protein product [Periconia digitata]|uniref:Uncharacterized protein n=1 Tax=Periconia digitata TaxID=1303443 RepID=A0A9W4UQ01_9PLEO|nr:unnamed protein product [Periconia digitata]
MSKSRLEARVLVAKATYRNKLLKKYTLRHMTVATYISYVEIRLNRNQNTPSVFCLYENSTEISTKNHITRASVLSRPLGHYFVLHPPQIKPTPAFSNTTYRPISAARTVILDSCALTSIKFNFPPTTRGIDAIARLHSSSPT